MVEGIRWSPTSLLLWGAGITLLLIAGLQYLRKARNRTEANEKLIMFGWAGFIFCFVANFVTTVIFDVFAAGTFVNGAYYFTLPSDWSQMSMFLPINAFIFYLARALGFVILFYAFERVYKKTHYIMTIVALGHVVYNLIKGVLFGAILHIELDPIWYRLIHIFYTTSAVSLLIILYFVTKWSRDEFKALASFFWMAWVILWAVYRESGNRYPDVGFLHYKPILLIISSILFIFPTVINPKFMKSASTYWKVAGVVLVCFSTWRGIYLISIGYWYSIVLNFVSIFNTALNILLTSYLLNLNSKSTVFVQKKNKYPDSYSRLRTIWKIVGILIICYGIIVYSYLTIVSQPTYYPSIFTEIINLIAVNLATIFLILLSFRSKMKVVDTKEIQGDGVVFLEAIARRQTLTEEEVSVSKEKKICLVCKGKLSGFNLFLCSDCETFYCDNCAQKLSKLENQCWVCNTPFIESKPSKALETIESSIKTEFKEK